MYFDGQLYWDAFCGKTGFWQGLLNSSHTIYAKTNGNKNCSEIVQEISIYAQFRLHSFTTMQDKSASDSKAYGPGGGEGGWAPRGGEGEGLKPPIFRNFWTFSLDMRIVNVYGFPRWFDCVSVQHAFEHCVFFFGGGEGGNNVTLPSPSKSEGARTPILILASDICFFT